MFQHRQQPTGQDCSSTHPFSGKTWVSGSRQNCHTRRNCVRVCVPTAGGHWNEALKWSEDTLKHTQAGKQADPKVPGAPHNNLTPTWVS